MSLIPSTGFDPNFSPSKLIVNGYEASADLTEAVSDAQLDRTISGASTLTLTIEDPHRVFVNSKVAQILTPATPTLDLDGSYSPSAIPYVPTTCAITDGTTELVFALASVEKEGDEVTLTFEDLIINQLRYAFATQAGYMSTSGTMTRADFMTQIISKSNVPTNAIAVPDGFNGVQDVQEQLQWGTSDSPTEDAWTCLTRLANEVQWRCFSTGQAIIFGPDEWLLSQAVAATFQEFTDGVDSIDFDWDMGQQEANATVNCVAQLLGFLPGQLVRLVGIGVASGLWIASEMERDLFTPDATLSVIQPQPSISEAQAAALNSGTATTSTPSASPQAGTGGSQQAQSAVAYALAQVGKPYQWGGTGPGAFDCSGLCYAAYASVGVTIPRTSEAQYEQLPHVPMSSLLPGDLIFYNPGEDGIAGEPGHVVMAIGNGNMVEAPHTGATVHVGPIYGGALGAARPVG